MKICYADNIEYYSTQKKNQIMKFGSEWIDFVQC